jgi:TolB-like protein/Flp pilus assembly protein TadD
VASVVLPSFDAPGWVMQAIIFVSALGFPFAIVLAWLYEWTPQGIKAAADLQPTSPAKFTDRRIDFFIIGFLVLAVLFLVFDAYVYEDTDEAFVSDVNSIAVLAFENFSTDPEDAYFADGLADEILSTLQRIRELKVASRSASLYFKGKDIDIGTIATTLQVGYVLSGGVRRYGDRIRVTAALDDTASSDLLWSETFDREVSDILEIQSNIARSVATAIVPVLSQRSERQLTVPPTESTEAYDFYLRGRDYLRQVQEEATLASAIQLFHRAIDVDAGFAQAYAGLCEAYLNRHYVSGESESFESAEDACRRAANLDDSLYEVHVSLGRLYHASGQYSAAKQELEKAIAQQPSAVSPYLALAGVYVSQNLVVEAEAMFRRAVELDSGNWSVHNEFGSFLWHVYRYEDAIPYYQRVIELVPDSGIGHDNLGVAYQALGEFEEANRIFDASPLPSRWTYSNRGLNYYYLGDYRRSVEDQLRAIEIAPDIHSQWGRLGDAYRFIPGEEENARTAYERGIELAERDLSINPSDWETLARLTTYYAHAGRSDQAAAGLQELFDLTSDPTAYYFGALTSLKLGDLDSVYDYLTRVVRSGWSRATLNVDPDLAALRGDPRLQALLSPQSR